MGKELKGTGLSSKANIRPLKTALVPHKVARKEAVRLTREDWLDAAFNAASQGGFNSVRVLLLSEALGVTRGSFYGHFTSHADLITALLARWRADEIAESISLGSEFTADPCMDMENVLEAAFRHGDPALGKVRFELALRELGRRDPAVAKMLLDVDRVRLSVLEGKFARLTGNPQRAKDLASLFYLSIVGTHLALDRPLVPVQGKNYIRDVISSYLIHQQIPLATPDK